MRRPSVFTRTLRSLTALVTVWCLGCGAFDPLIAALLPGAGAGMMVCASEAPTQTAAAQPTDDRVFSFDAPADRDRTTGATCDCGSCYAPAPNALAVTPSPQSLPHQPLAEVGKPPSVERAPLVPPPQRGA